MSSPSHGLRSTVWSETQCPKVREMFTLGLVLFLLLIQKSVCAPHERRLLEDLLSRYNILERPVSNETEPLFVSFGLALQQIIDVDEKNQILISNIWLKFEWVDWNLRWNVSDYGGITDLRIPPSRIWRPDVLMYNSADEKFDSTFQTNVVVRNNGSCLYIPPGIFKSMCKIDITWFPFDDQKCDMKFGSWTYGGFSLDLRISSEDGGDLSSYVTNGEWKLLEVPGVRNTITYTCCPEPYIDITYTIHLRRRTLYYGFNLIIPCMVISSMTLLGFTLPPESGEKISLGVTILLSMSVFMLQLTETLPPTSDAVSIIGTYFACIMVMVACSVVMTVIVLNLHHRSAETCDMPRWVKVVVITWLPILLRMSRPSGEDKDSNNEDDKEGSGAGSPGSPASPSGLGGGGGHQRKTGSLGGGGLGGGGISSINAHMKDYAERVGGGGGIGHPKELLVANVLDLDDDYLQLHALGSHHGRSGLPGSGLLGTPTGDNCNCYHHNLNSLPGLPGGGGCRRHPSNTFNASLGSHISSNFKDILHSTVLDGGGPPLPPGWADSPGPRLGGDDCPLDSGGLGGENNGLNCSSSNAQHTCAVGKDISSCLHELKFITNRMRKNDELEEIISDWKFAAMVLDRLCFYGFTAFTIISTFVCLSSAPQLIV